ncbi:MAG: hypothetical protein A2542_02635 [Parcubacteria group bacterium RIFOXYD2_FULL_52_8]|nr:MAG: hypothetical protein A2542_02635 [Parcubacteria group bacterium RIFOXYD2_FULL_52_8]
MLYGTISEGNDTTVSPKHFEKWLSAWIVGLKNLGANVACVAVVSVGKRKVGKGFEPSPISPTTNP